MENEKLISILKKLGFLRYDFEDSVDGGGICFSKVKTNKEESYYIRFTCFTDDEWRVEVRNCNKDKEGTLSFKDNEVSLEDVNSLIRICKINLILE